MTQTEIPTTVLYETAEILEENIPTDAYDKVRATLLYLHYSEANVDPEALRKQTDCPLDVSDAENIVYQLKTESILTDTVCDEAALQAVFTGAELLGTQPDPPENSFIATLPSDDPALNSVPFSPLLSGTFELIQSANDHVVLMSPFLSEDGFDRLHNALRTAESSGAEITLITNQLTYGKQSYNRDVTRGLLDDSDLGPVTTCYEYINKETWTTFHAKIITVDSQRAYLGTANLTHTGLSENLELGVIFRDETARDIDALVQALQQSEYLHRVARRGKKFVKAADQ